jgi:dihydroorotate dehydrogenase (NAD+) catalytic subunit
MNEDLILQALDYEVGAVTVGTYALAPKSTHPKPFITKVDCGYVNAYGIRRSIKEAEGFILKVLDKAEGSNAIVIGSVIEENVEGVVEAAKKMEELGVSMVELNLSAPILGKLLELGLNVELAERLIEAVKSEIDVPLSVKLSPLIIDLGGVGRRVARAGADVLHLVNALSPALVLDLETGAPIFKTENGYGALSGPAIKPIALGKVLLASKALPRTSIIGTGGVSSWKDVVEFIMVGASAVGLHSTLYAKGIRVLGEIVKGVKGYMKNKGYSSLDELRGLTHRYV